LTVEVSGVAFESGPARSPLPGNGITQIYFPSRRLRAIAYRAILDVPREPARYVAGLLAAERRARVNTRLWVPKRCGQGPAPAEIPIRAGEGRRGGPELLARLLGAGPGRSWRSMRHDGLPCCCDWRTWV
jgi:hypothetical protein